jgi:hypothetical protein
LDGNGNIFESDQKVKDLGITIDERRVTAQASESTSQENLSLKAKIRLSAAIQHSSTLFTGNEENCSWLNAYIPNIDMESESEKFSKATPPP